MKDESRLRCANERLPDSHRFRYVVKAGSKMDELVYLKDPIISNEIQK